MGEVCKSLLDKEVQDKLALSGEEIDWNNELWNNRISSSISMIACIVSWTLLHEHSLKQELVLDLSLEDLRVIDVVDVGVWKDLSISQPGLSSCGMSTLEVQVEYFFACFFCRKHAIVWVWIYNQQFQATITLTVFDFQAIPSKPTKNDWWNSWKSWTFYLHTSNSWNNSQPPSLSAGTHGTTVINNFGGTSLRSKLQLDLRNCNDDDIPISESDSGLSGQCAWQTDPNKNRFLDRSDLAFQRILTSGSWTWGKFWGLQALNR